MCEAIKGMREDAEAKGREEERVEIIKKLRKSGMTEEQIQKILNIELTDS